MITPEELHESLAEIIDKTKNGELSWIRTNPTTFVWMKNLNNQESVKVTIQKVSKRERRRVDKGLEVITSEHFIFQLTEPKNSLQLITLNTEDNPDYTKELMQLYEVASTNITKKGLDFLRRALDA